MYFNDHPPPHFHAKYHDFHAQVAIATAEIIQGDLPPQQWRLVKGWAEMNRDALLYNWLSLQETGKFDKIAPLQ